LAAELAETLPLNVLCGLGVLGGEFNLGCIGSFARGKSLEPTVMCVKTLSQPAARNHETTNASLEDKTISWFRGFVTTVATRVRS
jgi:hypothetical protein